MNSYLAVSRSTGLSLSTVRLENEADDRFSNQKSEESLPLNRHLCIFGYRNVKNFCRENAHCVKCEFKLSIA